MDWAGKHIFGIAWTARAIYLIGSYMLTRDGGMFYPEVDCPLTGRGWCFVVVAWVMSS